jgi:Zinc knuckle
MKVNEENESEVVQDLALFGGQFKRKCRNCGVIGHKAKNCKNKNHQNGTNNGNSQNRAYWTYCCRTGRSKVNCSKLKHKISQNYSISINQGNNDNYEWRNFDSTDVAFMANSKPA